MMQTIIPFIIPAIFLCATVFYTFGYWCGAEAENERLRRMGEDWS
jgi:hypothetical protein